MSNSDQTSYALLTDALQHLQLAIELLDAAGAPGQIAAHADMAVNQLQNELAKAGANIANRPVDEQHLSTGLWGPASRLN